MKLKKRIFCVLLFFLILSVPAFTLDLSLLFNLGNLALPRDTQAGSSTFSGESFPWGFHLSGQQMASDNTGVDVSFLVDPVLRNISYTLFSYKADFFTIGVGPFFGFFNTPQTILKSGISTSFKVEIPGIIYVSFRADSSIGGGLETAGDYTQERNDVSFGYYVQNAICSLNLATRRYAMMDAAAGRVVDGLTEYSFKTDMFKKNVPYRIILTFSYQQRTKEFADSVITHTLNSLVLGTELNMQVSKDLTLLALLDSTVYSFGFVDNAGTRDLLVFSDTWPGLFLFNAKLGAKLHLDM
ncbi:MAG: hypothetical protein JW760_05970 [Spirochaetales bacterium]|nr:hypothetical protein [Spirochaetales bacterium]